MTKINKLSKDIKNSFAVDLPAALKNLKAKRILAACIAIIASTAASIGFKTPSFLIGFIIAAYLIFIALKINYDMYKGYIIEKEGICVTSTARRSKTVEIVFMDDTEKTFSLLYPSKNNPFVEAIKYKIYVSQNNPKLIIAYENI